MTKNERIIVLRWYNTYGDPILEEDYDLLQKEFAKHPDIETLFDCDRAGVFSYPDDAHDALMMYKDSLFEPEYYDNIEEMSEMYEEEDLSALFSQLEYDLELRAIGKMAGDDDKEFDRLWTERFVFGDEEALCY